MEALRVVIHCRAKKPSQLSAAAAYTVRSQCYSTSFHGQKHSSASVQLQ